MFGEREMEIWVRACERNGIKLGDKIDNYDEEIILVDDDGNRFALSRDLKLRPILPEPKERRPLPVVEAPMPQKADGMSGAAAIRKHPKGLTNAG